MAAEDPKELYLGVARQFFSSLQKAAGFASKQAAEGRALARKQRIAREKAKRGKKSKGKRKKG